MKKILLTTLVCLTSLYGCSKAEENSGPNVESSQPSKSTTPVAQKPPQPTQEEIEAKLKQMTLSDFVEQSKPSMNDTIDSRPQASSYLVNFMNLKDIKIKDILKLPQTSRGKILKDPEAERGHQLCVTGNLVQISANRKSGNVEYTGIMMDQTFQPVIFAAVGDTGELVARSKARFCGIVIGKMSYSNTGGGQSSGPYLVGLFDLKKNK